jgi:hypothetical protein
MRGPGQSREGESSDVASSRLKNPANMPRMKKERKRSREWRWEGEERWRGEMEMAMGE